MLSGRLLVRGRRCRVQDRSSRRDRSAVTAQCVPMAIPTTSHSARPTLLHYRCCWRPHIPLHTTRPPPSCRGDSAPGNSASSTHPLVTRPEQTGPRADSKRPIILGVNINKGVYVVRQLTPPLPAHRSAVLPKQPSVTKSPWQPPLEPGAGSRDLRRASRLLFPCESTRGVTVKTLRLQVELEEAADGRRKSQW